ncbi:MAG TPA: 3-isopropylmalate dehydratase small subunit [Firmicutes bacterium]|nr:3-isopropylmalate dehydratase small subunit [Bacillota bacterium]
MKIKGRAWKFGNDVDTDAIIPARYLNTSDPQVLAQHCFEDIDREFVQKIKPGDVIVAGKNFGCGSSREHAPIAIKAAGISIVIASSFARIFYRNSINIGLPILESPAASLALEEGQEVEVDLKGGKIINLSTGDAFEAVPFPAFMQELIEAGGLIGFTRERLKRTGTQD